MNGQVLSFRLFQDGVVEYEEYCLQQGYFQAFDVEKIKSMKRVNINKDEFNELILILTSEEFSRIQPDIKQQQICPETTINTKIDFSFEKHDKNILVENYCFELSGQIPQAFNNFPPIINELFRKVKTIKDKESRGKFYN